MISRKTLRDIWEQNGNGYELSENEREEFE